MEPLRKGISKDITGTMNNSMRNLPTGGDYATGVNILPVIGSEVNLDVGKSDRFTKINSKVELTKKDI